MQAELAQTAKEFASVKKMQKTQKTEDMNTMESAAENIEKAQEEELEASKRVIVAERMQFVGLDFREFDQAHDDNMRMLRDFFTKWIGAEDPNDLHLTVERGPALALRASDSVVHSGGSLLQLNRKVARRMRGSLATQTDVRIVPPTWQIQTKEEEQQQEEEQEQEQEGSGSDSVFTEGGIIVSVEVSIAADRQGDIDSTKDLFTKIASGQASSEIAIAVEELVETLCSDANSAEDGSRKKCSLKAEKPTTREIVLDNGATGSQHTNATLVAEAATAGNLTDIGSAINAKDTPDIASAVEAQKMEEVLSEETPRQPRPDQSLPGPPFPGAWGTLA